MDPQPDDKAERESGSHWVSVTVALCVPVLYVLLLGPAARLHESSSRGVQQVLEAVYMPLEWLDTKLPSRPFSSYARLWRKNK